MIACRLTEGSLYPRCSALKEELVKAPEWGVLQTGRVRDYKLKAAGGRT